MGSNTVTSRISSPWFACFLITLVAVVIYSNTYKVPFVFDGTVQIEDKVQIRDLKNYLSPSVLLSRRPMVEATFALNYRFGRLDLFDYHLVNVLVHVINGFLVYFLAFNVFKRLYSSSRQQFAPIAASTSRANPKQGTARTRRATKSEKRAASQSLIPLMSLFAALIFVAHPIQTQAVTYIVQRYTSMAAMFYLASVLLYIKARALYSGAKGTGQKAESKTQQRKDERDRARAQGQRSKRKGGDNTTKDLSAPGLKVLAYFTLSFLCGMLAFLSKESSASLPGVIILSEYLLFDRTWQGWKRKIVWFGSVFLLLGIFFLYVSGFFRGDLQFGRLLEDVSGLMKETGAVGRWSYLYTQFNVVAIYIRLLFIPIGQNLDYMYPFKAGFFDGYTPAAFLFLIAIIGLGIWNVKKRPVISFGIFWFFITLSVESSIIPISDALFEHRLYLPMFGFVLVVIYLVFDLLSERRSWAVVTSISIIICLGVTTYVRNRVWQDPVTLWTDVVSKTPKNHRGHNNLGFALNDQGRLNLAVRHLLEALRIKPGFALAHTNLGTVLLRQGRVEEAIDHLSAALLIAPFSVQAHNNLGAALANKGEFEEAIRHFSEALRIKPGFAEAHNGLGNAYATQGRVTEAVKHWSKALEINPDYASAHYNLAIVLEQRGLIREAKGHLSEAVRINPDYAEAHTNLGFILERQGDIEGASRHFFKALQIKPGLVKARRGLEKTLRLMRGSRGAQGAGSR